MSFRSVLAFSAAFLVLGLGSGAGALGGAVSGTWSGVEIATDEGTFTPSGSYLFELVDLGGGQDGLKLTLTSTGSETANWQLLAGLLWDIDGVVTLTTVSAMVSPGSSLVNPISAGTDVSGHWAFKDDISIVNFGQYGVGGAGDIIFGADTFGSQDCFVLTGNPAKCLGNSPDGADYLITNATDFDLANSDGLPSSNPLIRNSAMFLWSVDNTDFTISNVDPIFGTTGAPLIPEPGAVGLFSVGLLVAARMVRKPRQR